MSCQCESCLYNHDATRRMENCRKMTGSFFDTMLETLCNTEILGYKLVPLDSTT